jgi:hypothetical protein
MAHDFQFERTIVWSQARADVDAMIAKVTSAGIILIFGPLHPTAIALWLRTRQF